MYQKKRISTACIFLLLLTLLVTTACTPGQSQTTNQSQQDILSQKVTPEGKTPLTVLVKYAFSINSFEAAVERKFPDLDLIQVGNYTSDRGLVEYARRLEHDDLTDIVMTWPLNVGSEYWEDRLLDLSALPFTSNYHVSMLDTISKDGKLYYLPGPAQVRGIVYNKTLFAEKGWQVPTNFDEFVGLCQEIENSGIRSIQLGFGNSEVLDTAFVGYSFGDCFSKPQDTLWLESYNNGEGSSAQLLPAFQTFEKMRNAGIWKDSDLDITYSTREKMLFTRQCAMVEDSVLMARMGLSQTGTTDQFALMPFFSPNDNSDWARLYMVCYIGLNKHLAESANKEKYDLAIKVMEYISSPEGQEALAGDTGAMYSSVKGVAPPDIAEIKDLVPALTAGRYAIFPELANAQGALREGLTGLLKGTTTIDQVIKSVDAQNIAPKESDNETVIGTASETFTLIETGNFITDTMRKKLDTDIALFMDNGKDGRYNGKGVSGKIYKGNQTKADILRISPDLKGTDKGLLQKITMTGENLIKTLEYSIPVDNNNTGWFYYFSGLKMEYDPTAEPGSRINEITMSDGTAIDPEKKYTIAIMNDTVPANYIASLHETGISIIALLMEEIETQETISPSGDGRFVVPK